MNSKQRLDEPTLFIDRNLGKHIIAERLLSEGVKVEAHDDHLPSDAPDEVWLKLIAEHGWIAITRDKNIRYRSAEIEAIRRHGASVIVVRMKSATGEAIAETILKARDSITQFVELTPAPFVAGLYASGKLTAYPI